MSHVALVFTPQAVLNTLSIGASLLLPPLRERTELLLSLLPQGPQSLNVLSKGQVCGAPLCHLEKKHVYFICGCHNQLFLLKYKMVTSNTLCFLYMQSASPLLNMTVPDSWQDKKIKLVPTLSVARQWPSQRAWKL